MRRGVRSQLSDLRRILSDPSGVHSFADSISSGPSKGVLLVGSGSSFVAALQAKEMLKGVIRDVEAVDLDRFGRHSIDDHIIIVFSNSGAAFTKVREMCVNAQLMTIGPKETGAQLATTSRELGGVATTSHTGALLRAAQIAKALGADLELDSIIDQISVVDFTTLPYLGLQVRSVDIVHDATHKWTGNELAIKLRECARLPSSSFSFSDYLHGGFSSLATGQALVLLPDDSMNSARAERLVRAGERVGAEVHILGTTGAGHGICDVIAMTVECHRFAYATAKKRGLHPDTLGSDDPVKREGWRILRGAATGPSASPNLLPSAGSPRDALMSGNLA